MTWLITGGAGYVGSHVAWAMARAGERVAVLDDLSSGVAARLHGDGVPLVRGSTLDRELLDRTLAGLGVTGVVHLAARKQVAESVAQPLRYYRENVHGLTVLLEAVAAAGVERFVFSSSAAVYGTPQADAVTEDTPCRPVSPYGETKLAGEWLVRAAGAAHGLATACLRYFNVAGAGRPELADTAVTNVVPMMFERVSRGQGPLVFGTDYPTPDGTCVRDYVHVADVASAHLAVARHLAGRRGAGDLTANVGTGRGVSVRELADLVCEVTGRPDLAPVAGPRRPGDPARVVGSAARIGAELGWRARHSVREMVESAWEGWRLRHGAGGG
ncbi:UDP-glucose 4-epimerase GalE [Streptomyces sp. B1866]|uniref:UDP-glucose 4-epimerase GalE n=1 Tax=Streptomyces sp. B1866 TaxID=3075431 RepID=UPI00288E4A07|nr:UDP-glucose 4-epimerase GalE [Streptomyces sp. B1866]MDT3400727.1 UDP-glucose 4-epimerase GalE [Streptomyces sp. B1866]